MKVKQSIGKELVTFIRITSKVILWVVIGFVLIFITLAFLIQIPAVQTKIVHYATNFISNTTHTKVEIKKVGISFPKSVVIEGLYLEDLQKDTFLYAGKAKINMAFFELFSNKVAISSLALEDASLKLYRNKLEPSFNYNFLITAFGDTTRQIDPETLTASKWKFSLEQVYLQNFRLLYNDEFTGMNVVVALKNTEFNMHGIDTENSVYNFGELLIDGSFVNILAKESANNPNITSDGVSPTITAKIIRVIHSNISYTDSVGNFSVSLVIDSSRLENVSINIQNELLTSDNVYLSKSKIQHHSFEPETLTDMTSELPIPLSGSNWKVSMNHIVMDNNIFIHKSGDKQGIKNSFNPDYLEYNHLMLDAADFWYSSDQARISLKNLTATDQNNFAITRLEGELIKDSHSITVTELKANISKSGIEADLNIEYTSPGTRMNSGQISNLNIDLKNVSITNSDILYFNPGLIRQPFFKNRMNTTTISGSIHGPVNNLNGENLVIHTGVNTIIKTDFIIKGLPDVRKAFFNFPNLSIFSGKKDIEKMSGISIPGNMELPEDISLQLVFKGDLKSFESNMRLSSSFGAAQLFAVIDKNENFRSTVNITDFDLGRLLKDKAWIGPVSLAAEASGQGLDLKTIKAKVKADVTKIYLNKYTYHNLKMNGTITGREFAGIINLKDENAVIDFDGLLNLNPDQERVKFRLNVQGADLQKLNLTRDDIRIALVAETDLKGGSVNKLNGTAGIYNMIVARGGKKFVLDSLLFASINEPDKSESKFSSALVGVKYSGTVSPADFSAELKNFINNYFPFSDSKPLLKGSKPSDFNFEIQLHNHPILSQVLLPELTEFEPGVIQGSFDSQKNDLKLKATMKKIVYGTIEIKDFAMVVNSDTAVLNYKISGSNISNEQFGLADFSFDGKMADNKIIANISSMDGKQNKKLLIRSQIVKNNDNFKLTLDPEEFYLMDNQWDIAADNYIEFGKQGLLIHRLFMNHAESQVNISSVHDRFNDDLNFAIKNFELGDISRIIEKDTSLIKGNMDGNVLFKRVNNTYGLIADAMITDLKVRNVPIGILALKTESLIAGKFYVDMNLRGADNKATANGYFITNDGNNSFHIEAEINSLSMKTVEAFSMGKITEAAGTLSGNLSMAGSSAAPDITGELIFNNAFIKPAVLNNRLELKHETVQFTKDGIYFKSFTVLDADQHTAIVDGTVQMKQFKDFIFALKVSTKDFLLFNTTAMDNKEFYGRMVVDSKIDVSGPMTLPVVNAKLKMKKGSDFTFAVPEDKLTTDKGEDVVEFEDSLKLNSILNKDVKNEIQKSGITGLDLTSIIEIDKEATLRLLLDPASTDALVVKGEAALSFTMDRSGKMSLTGAYNLDEGSYLVSLETVIKKKFDINAGSTIIWNGDPLGADISIDATYSVRA
jgi:hypothetical protein